MFNDQINADLDADLDPKYVKTRKLAGRDCSYIESWRAIAEANRIFGFDGWTSETIELKCVSERERTIGKDQYQKPGFGVSYIARVRITVGEIVREGVGAGHGIDADMGQAHESAIKEAESDARKRSLMTFGWPFGLALYDKQQEHVADEPRPQAKTPPPIKDMAPLLSEPLATKVATQLRDDINGCVTLDELSKFIQSDAFKHSVGSLPEKHRGATRQHYQARAAAIKDRSTA